MRGTGSAQERLSNARHQGHQRRREYSFTELVRRAGYQETTRVVFLDPFGASVEWKVIEAISKTKAVDLWILFPYAAINRMLVSRGMPPEAWAAKLTGIFGTDQWKEDFYSTSSWKSLIDSEKRVERIYKTADQEKITEFFLQRLREEFAAVAKPGYLYNSRGLLFVLMFAAGNDRGAHADEGSGPVNAVKFDSTDDSTKFGFLRDYSVSG
jgi:three-Cys-motif partner protein